MTQILDVIAVSLTEAEEGGRLHALVKILTSPHTGEDDGQVTCPPWASISSSVKWA